MVGKQVLTTFEAAALCSVSYNTIKNWIKRDFLSAYRTAGGHLRIRREDLESFSRQFKIPMQGGSCDILKAVVYDSDGSFTTELKNVKIRACELEILAAVSAFEAGMMVESVKPDFVFLGSSSSDSDYYNACDAIRRSPALKHVRIAVAADSLTDKGSAGQMAHCLGDPVDHEKLIEFVQSPEKAKSGVRSRRLRKAAK